MLWLCAHLTAYHRTRIRSRRFISPTMHAHFGEKAAVISDYRVILYNEPKLFFLFEVPDSVLFVANWQSLRIYLVLLRLVRRKLRRCLLQGAR